MTIKELYEEAKKLGIEDYSIELRYRDGGGPYTTGCDTLEKIEEIDNVFKYIII